jgi:chromosome segregation ATPase
MKQIITVIGIGILLSSCVSARKTYQPPSNAKVTASTQRVKSDITTAHQTARTAKTHVTDAQKSADKISVLSLTVQQKLDVIIKAAPPELQSALTAVKLDVTNMQTEEGVQHGSLANAQKTQDSLEKQLTDLETHETDLEAQQAAYYMNAQGLADSATKERSNLITTQKELLASRFGGIIAKILIVLAGVVLVGLAVLWFLGKISIGAAGVASKLP